MIHINLYVSLFSGIALILFGLNLFGLSYLEFGEKLLFNFFRHTKSSKKITLKKGFTLGILSINEFSLYSTLVSMVQAGLLRKHNSLILISFAQIFYLIPIFVLLKVNFIVGTILLTIALISYVFMKGRFREPLENSFRLFVGLGLIGIGTSLFSDSSVLYFQLDEVLTRFLNFNHLLIFIANFVISIVILIIFSNTGAYIILLMLLSKIGDWSFLSIFPQLVGVFFANHFLSQFRVNKTSNLISFERSILILDGIFILICFICFIFLPTYIETFDNTFLFFVFLRVVYFLISLVFNKKLTYLKWKKNQNFQISSTQNQLIALSSAADLPVPLGLIQAGFHLSKFKQVLDRLFILTQEYLKSDIKAKALAKIKDYERITDNMREEIHHFLTYLGKQSLSQSESETHAFLSYQANELESIADYLDKVASYSTRFNRDGGNLGPLEEEFHAFFDEVRDFYLLVSLRLPLECDFSEEKVSSISLSLKKRADDIRQNHLQRFQQEKMDSINLMTYSDMIISVRKIRGHTLKLYNALVK